MPTKLIKGNRVADDQWQRIGDDAETPLPEGPVIVPLSVWQASRDQLIDRQALGVCLGPADAASDIADDLERFQVIAIDFPAFTDGRGFSTARELRERYQYQGELRAVGQFIRDQLFYLKRCGFDAFAIETCEPEAALSSLNDFSNSYQAANDQPQPLFRRR